MISRSEIAFPEANKFSDLFEEWKWSVHGLSEGYPRIKCNPKITFTNSGVISDHCNALSCAVEDNLHVKPRPEVIDFINKNLFISDYDSIYFEIIGKISGALVTVKNSKIIGGRYLALLPSAVYKEIEEAAGPKSEEN